MGSLEQEFVYYHAGGKRGRRPVLTGADAKDTFESIPIIDVSGMFSESLSERKKVAVEIGKAAREVGFFYAQNHSVPEQIVTETFDAMKKFFALPLEDKMEVHIHKSQAVRGYEPPFETKMDPNSKGDMKEAFSMGEDAHDPEQKAPFLPGPDYPKRNNWPTTAPDLRPAIYAYYSAILDFAKRMMRIFALALDLEETYFDDATKFPMTGIRALHYPPQKVEGAEEIGLGAHTDYVFFTLVCQGSVAALEVLNANGIWVPAPPIQRTFVVNIGDFLQRITNYKFQSTVHRVVNKSGEERYSMPFFFSPDKESTLAVLPNCRKEGEEYEELNAGEYFRQRLLAARYQHPAAREHTGMATPVA